MFEVLEEIFKDDIEKRETRINQLTIKMVKDGRTDELVRSASDPEYQKQLMEEYGLLND